MRIDCWCPNCQKMVKAGKVRTAWFVFFLLFLRGDLLIYLAYCLFTKKRICQSCKKRIPYHPEKPL